MGYVYVFKAGDACKIGITSRDVSSRASQVQTGCPTKIEKIWSSNCIENYKSIERMLHGTFSDKRTSGEWFSEDFDIIVNKAKAIIANNPYVEKSKKNETIPLEKHFLTITETSIISGLSTFFIRNGVKNGTIPHIKCGNKAMINYPKFIKMLDETRD